MGAGLLLLGDSRFPAGGPVPCGGLEKAIARGDVRDIDGLTGFLLRRLYGTGSVQAAFAALAALTAGPFDLPETSTWAELDTELDARIRVPADRAVSRARGRSLRRIAEAAWPGEGWEVLGTRPHHAIVLGAAATRARLDAREAAVLAATDAVTVPVRAATEPLSLDPVTVTVLLAGMTGHCDEVADAATEAARTVHADGDWDRLPVWSAAEFGGSVDGRGRNSELPRDGIVDVAS